jgi:hypothetical protein
MLQRCSRLAVLVALLGSFVAIPATSALAQGGNNPNTNRLEIPITGVVQNVGTLAGTLAISRFAIVDGALVAMGQLTATITDAAGNVVRTIVTNLTIPVLNATGSCEILSLVLGPLHLDLLGLQIDLNQVVLDITAQSGPGNLLGNLLCAIAGLLDAGNLGQGLVGLLNNLLGALARL